MHWGSKREEYWGTRLRKRNIPSRRLMKAKAWSTSSSAWSKQQPSVWQNPVGLPWRGGSNLDQECPKCSESIWDPSWRQHTVLRTIDPILNWGVVEPVIRKHSTGEMFKICMMCVEVIDTCVTVRDWGGNHRWMLWFEGGDKVSYTEKYLQRIHHVFLVLIKVGVGFPTNYVDKNPWHHIVVFRCKGVLKGTEIFALRWEREKALTMSHVGRWLWAWTSFYQKTRQRGWGGGWADRVVAWHIQSSRFLSGTT